MKSKLTLTVNRSTVEKAKVYVSRTSGSLSGLIENFLENLAGKPKKHSIVDATRGLLKGKMGFMSDSEIRKAYYKQKHGV